MTYTEDRDLARRAARADAGAWDEIIGRYGEKIYNLSCRFAGLGAEAEDLTQDIFLKLYRNLDRYRGDVPLVAWALRLSRNLCIDHYRAGRARHLADTVSDEVLDRLPGGDDPQARAHHRQQLRLVTDALSALPEALATVVMLRDFQDLSYEEIAAFLEVPVGTVKSRLNRARRALTTELDRRMVTGEAGAARTGRTSC